MWSQATNELSRCVIGSPAAQLKGCIDSLYGQPEQRISATGHLYLLVIASKHANRHINHYWW